MAIVKSSGKIYVFRKPEAGEVVLGHDAARLNSFTAPNIKSAFAKQYLEYNR